MVVGLGPVDLFLVTGIGMESASFRVSMVASSSMISMFFYLSSSIMGSTARD